ncbi:MAG TPA: hypothetical protein VFR41_07375 [Acidimicrobiia bacterium]|nr:hypothetical protein [Acidimicrobiia bacterium]
MDESKWERYAALGGIWFVGLGVVSALLPGAPPSLDDSNAKIAQYFGDHSSRIAFATFLVGLGIIGLLWWLGSLWRVMVGAEGGRPRLAVVAVASLAIGATLALAAGSVLSTTALQHDEIGSGAKVFYALQVVLFAAAGFAIVSHIAAVTALSYRTRLFAPWINVIGWIAALLFLISTLATASDANFYNVLGLIAFVAWCVWIVAVSLSMWQRVAEPVAAT